MCDREGPAACKGLGATRSPFHAPLQQEKGFSASAVSLNSRLAGGAANAWGTPKGQIALGTTPPSPNGQIAVVWRAILLGGGAAGRALKLGSDIKQLEEMVPALPLKKLGCPATLPHTADIGGLRFGAPDGDGGHGSGVGRELVGEGPGGEGP